MERLAKAPALFHYYLHFKYIVKYATIITINFKKENIYFASKFA